MQLFSKFWKMTKMGVRTMINLYFFHNFLLSEYNSIIKLLYYEYTEFYTNSSNGFKLIKNKTLSGLAQ